MNAIILSETELQEKIYHAVRQEIEQRINSETPKVIRTKNLDVSEAIDYLNSIGYKCSSSLIYKLTMRNEIPFEKFGRRMIFNADDLTKWVEGKKQKKVDVNLAVSKCATTKLLRK